MQLGDDNLCDCVYCGVWLWTFLIVERHVTVKISLASLGVAGGVKLETITFYKLFHWLQLIFFLHVRQLSTYFHVGVVTF